MSEKKTLRRSRDDRVIAGVCGGLGSYFKIDPVILRVIWVLLIFGFGTGILAYLICWLVIPPEPEYIVMEAEDE